MNSQQQAFLEHVATLIPKLFDAIRLGNVKSECVLGDRIIGQRQVRLKLVAEVVDPGSNPLATHSQMRQNQQQSQSVTSQSTPAVATNQANRTNQSKLAENTDQASQPVVSSQAKPTPPRRGSRRNHPMSR